MGDQLKRGWAELRRRRVVSTAAAYAAVSFVLLQLAEILFPAFAWGPSQLRLLFALLIAGFPIIMALSWVYDVTSKGVRRTDPGGTEAGPPRVLVGGVVLSAIALGWGGFWAVTTVETGTAVTDTSIAVLPFRDMSADQDQGYFGDGLAEEVLNILAQVEGLQVAARTSSFAFRENDDIRAIGEQLGVATILEGSVQRDANSIRVTAQLIDTQSGFHLWSRTYDRELEDRFAVQDEIAQSIAQEIFPELNVTQVSGERHVPVQAAQDAYWRGKAQWDRRDAAGLPEAINLFSQAIELDSLYAEAYAGLAGAWAILPQFFPSQSSEDALSTAEDLARQAIALNDNLPEPHASLGLALALRGDRFGALQSLGKAVAVGPSYAPAFHWRANVHAEMGQLGDALRDAAQAAALDKLSAAIAVDYANIMLWSGDLEGARAEFERAGGLRLGFAPAVFGGAMVALQAGEAVDLQMALTEWAVLLRLPVAMVGELSSGMLAFGGTGAQQTVPAALPAMGQAGMIPAGTVASLHALLGDVDGTLQWLAAAVEDRSWVDLYLRVNPIYDLVRADAEFMEIRAQVGA